MLKVTNKAGKIHPSKPHITYDYFLLCVLPLFYLEFKPRDPLLEARFIID